MAHARKQRLLSARCDRSQTMKKRDKWIEDRLDQELLAGEKLLWYDQPIPMRLAILYPLRMTAGILWFIVIFALLNTIFRVLMLRAALLLPILFAIFIVIGGFIISKPLNAFIKAGGTIYAVTNRRVIVVKPGAVTSYSADDIQFIERRDRGNDSGDVILGHETVADPATGEKQRQKIGFFGVRNVTHVEAMLLETFRPDASLGQRASRLSDSGGAATDETQDDDSQTGMMSSS